MKAGAAVPEKQKRLGRSGFSRGKTVNYFPKDTSLDKDTAIEDFMIHGWMPNKTFVNKEDPIVAFGSCFAGNIAKYLDDRGYNVLTKRDNKAYVTQMADGMVHTYAIRQQFEWAWLNKTPTQELWHGYDAEEFGYSEDARRDTREIFNDAKIFIITLGLSEVWYDDITQEVFWRAVPSNKIDRSRHKFRVSTVAENLENLKVIHSLIRKFRPDAAILFSLSPIPLTATFRPVSCITANAVSKAILRVAIDELVRDSKDDRLFYFPSYEIVTNIFNNQWTSDRKHVYPHVLDFNMKVFEHYFCIDGLDRKSLEESYRVTRRLDKIVGERGHDALSVHTDQSLQERRTAKLALRKEHRAGPAESGLKPDALTRRANRLADRKAEKIAKRRALLSVSET